jgi:iron complex outermembrane receptor protein
MGALTLALSVHAAEEGASRDDATLAEVVVTAQKRQELLQDVPASILVTSGEELIDKNVEGLDELYKLVPGFGTANYQNNYTISIRGIGTSSFSHAVQPSVGTVVDGVPIGRSGVSVFNFNDVERIEVLRGPQSTLFGMNSSGGVLNVVTQQPTQEMEGKVRIRYGTYNSIQLDTTVSGPLVADRLAGRLSYYSSKRDGFVHNLETGKKENDDDQQGFLGKLAFTPRDSTHILLSADWVDRRYNCCLPTSLVANSDPISQQYLGAISRPGNNKVYGTDRQNFTDRIKGVGLQWEEQLGEFLLTSITGYREWELSNHATGNQLPDPYGIVQLVDYALQQNQWSQELRLTSPLGGRIDYVLGAFFFKQRVQSQSDLRLDLSSVVNFPFRVQIYSYDTTDNLNYALFGDANLHLSDTFTVFGGVRRTEDEIDMEIVGLPRLPGYNPGGTPPGVIADDISAGAWSWRIGSRWTPNENHSLYATISRGYKGPAFNTNSAGPFSQRVDGEVSTNYELGWKSSALGNRLRANLALFWTDFKDFQADGIQDPDGNGPQPGQFILLNAGKLESKGVELEVEALPVRNLTLGLRAAYIDATYGEFLNAPCYGGQTVATGCTNSRQDLSGGKLPNTPELSGNLSAAYEFDMGSQVQGFMRADYTWRDEVYWDPLNNPQSVEGAYGLVGASLGVKSSNDRYRVSIYGENLTDKVHGPLTYNGTAVRGPLISQTLGWDYSRLYGISFEYNF